MLLHSRASRSIDASLSKLRHHRTFPFQRFDNVFPDAALHLLTFPAGHDRGQATPPPSHQLLDRTLCNTPLSYIKIANSRDSHLKAIMSPKSPMPLLPNRARANQRSTSLLRSPRQQPQIHEC